MTRTIEFPLVISRTVQVKAVLRRVSGEPGSVAIQDGWEIDQCEAVDQDGNEVRDEAALQQIDEAVREHAGR